MAQTRRTTTYTTGRAGQYGAGRYGTGRYGTSHSGAGRTNMSPYGTDTYRTGQGRTGQYGSSRKETRSTGNGNIYIYDNTARKLDIQRELEEEPRKKLSRATRKNRDKARHMSLGYVLFLAAALCTCAFILINYIQLQAELTNKTKNLARLESKLNTIKLENDENYNRITSNIDLEEIKRIAIGELGMTYAQEGQIITYTSAGNDYMRQVGEE